MFNLIFSTLFIFMQIGSQQSSMPIQQVEFTSGTRGYSENIRITPDSIFVEKNGFRGNSSFKAAIEPAAWQLLTKSLDKVDLHEIHTLHAPSMNRASDGAMFSRLTITADGNTYSSQDFDNHHPPTPLVPLMQAIDSLSMQE